MMNNGQRQRQRQRQRGRGSASSSSSTTTTTVSSSCSSSIDPISATPPLSSSCFSHYYSSSEMNLSTDLRLGLSISPAAAAANCVADHHDQEAEEECNGYDENGNGINDEVDEGSTSTLGTFLYVKIYMEGHPIGRKIDLLAHHGFHDLITSLENMFSTNILWGDEVDRVHSGDQHHQDFHVLTYEDEEGDLLMVGDVPWEMFLSAVKRLKITRAFPC